MNLKCLMPTEQDTAEAVKGKEQSALKWLENNFPNYKDVVSNELEKLKAEIKQVAPQIVASSGQASHSRLYHTAIPNKLLKLVILSP